ncbi:hypothetical protein DPMN_015175 [Dreissena polymorpha]|uniref:Zinc finger PHD-type domain-containing protein n=1 Tax=Dreissena polymorpha TaxID=45954 RepID=A0A9D4NB32_DREPO|nr:hypothetical protein DPMN_015175 [Dreissena polymorpha]
MEFMRKRANWYPCGDCKLQCASACLFCAMCSQWYHGVCENVSDLELYQWGEIDMDYICKRCRLVDNCNFDYSQGLSRLKNCDKIEAMLTIMWYEMGRMPVRYEYYKVNHFCAVTQKRIN